MTCLLFSGTILGEGYRGFETKNSQDFTLQASLNALARFLRVRSCGRAEIRGWVTRSGRVPVAMPELPLRLPIYEDALDRGRSV